MAAISFEAIIAGIDAIPSDHLSRDHARRLAALRAQLWLLAREMKVDDSDIPLSTIGPSSTAPEILNHPKPLPLS